MLADERHKPANNVCKLANFVCKPAESVCKSANFVRKSQNRGKPSKPTVFEPFERKTRWSSLDAGQKATVGGALGMCLLEFWLDMRAGRK